jgi:hypothetical protein
VKLEVSTVLLQWAAGGLFFCWVTTRRREAGIGYGWTLRITYLALALAGALAGRVLEARGAASLLRDLGALGVAGATGWALALSVARRRAGVAGERDRRRARAARVEAMTGRARPERFSPEVAEFPPAADLVAPAIGALGLAAAAAAAGGPFLLALARLVVGAAFLGAVSDAMLLGHWHLVQPGLSRKPLEELVRWTALIWPVEVALLLVPPGMARALSGDDALLGWIWLVCALGTIVLAFAVQAAVKERSYSAVMAATGLLYLAILTAFGTDLVARAVLAP